MPRFYGERLIRQVFGPVCERAGTSIDYELERLNVLRQADHGPKRICTACNRPIGLDHKWTFVDGRPRHRHCDNPDDYYTKAERAAINAKRD